MSRTKTRASGGGRKIFLTSPYIDQAFPAAEYRALRVLSHPPEHVQKQSHYNKCSTKHHLTQFRAD